MSMRYAIQFDNGSDPAEYISLYKVYSNGKYSMWHPETREWDTAGKWKFEWIPKGSFKYDDHCWNREATEAEVFAMML